MPTKDEQIIRNAINYKALNKKPQSKLSKAINILSSSEKGKAVRRLIPGAALTAAGLPQLGVPLMAGATVNQGVKDYTPYESVGDAAAQTVGLHPGEKGYGVASVVGEMLNPGYYMTGPLTKVVDAAVSAPKAVEAANATGRISDTAKLAEINQKAAANVGWGPKQTLNVTRAGEYDQMYFPERWDVVQEGANPYGVWLQGKLGTPRTEATNPGKGLKAAQARNTFATRPEQYKGNVTLDKPLVTVGDVSDRSALSYQADAMGADGLIYNGVYDNGYNNNQVILSFRNPELVSTQRMLKENPTQKGEVPRWQLPKGERNQPDNTALPTKGFDSIPKNDKTFYRVTTPTEVKDIKAVGELRVDPISRFDINQLKKVNSESGIPMEELLRLNASETPYESIREAVMNTDSYKQASAFDQWQMRLLKTKMNHGDKGFAKGNFFPTYEADNPLSRYFGSDVIIGTPRKSGFLQGHHGSYGTKWGYDIPVGQGMDSSSAVLRSGFGKDNFKLWSIGEDGKWYLSNLKQGGILKRVESGKSGIHINPKNKGKFTETKKRTGKTTEELTHSKNPLTRKRAIFAQNAAKWHKK